MFLQVEIIKCLEDKNEIIKCLEDFKLSVFFLKIFPTYQPVFF
jgi:hypothetical protein